MAPQVAKKKVLVKKEPPTKKLAAGDLVCGDCGEGNTSTRKFCSRCGNSLENAEKVKEKWWRRLIPKRKQKVLEAGARPGQGDVKAKKSFEWKAIWRKVRLAGSIVLILAGLLYSVYAPFRSAVNERWNSVYGRVSRIIKPEFAEVNVSAPSMATASMPDEAPTAEGRECCSAQLATDNFTNTYWEAPFSPGSGAVLSVQFAGEHDFERLVVFNGDQDDPGASSRPEILHIVFFPSGNSVDVELDDKPGKQTHELSGGGGASSATVEIKTVDVAPNNPNVTAIAEIEFHEKD